MTVPASLVAVGVGLHIRLLWPACRICGLSHAVTAFSVKRVPVDLTVYCA